jgi:hypothetical protein
MVLTTTAADESFGSTCRFLNDAGGNVFWASDGVVTTSRIAATAPRIFMIAP